MKKVVIAVLLLCGLALGQGKEKVAVYMAGEEPRHAKGIHEVLGSQLANAISRSEKYDAIDRTTDIVDLLSKEMDYQRSGSVSDEQIKAMGRQFGVDYLCIAKIVPFMETYNLDVRLVDVETARLKYSVVESSLLRNSSDGYNLAKSVAARLVGGEKAERAVANRELRKKAVSATAVCFEAAGVGMFVYGVTRDIAANSRVLDKGSKEEIEELRNARNISYIIGGALLLGGISIHIFF